MKTFFHLFSCLALFANAAFAQSVAFLGEPNSDDEVGDILYTADGGFLVTGKHGAKGALYKLDCAGNVVGFIEKSLGTELVFKKSVQLANGSIVAVGTAADVPTATDTLPRLVLLKTDKDLHELAFQHFTISNKATLGESLAVANDGTLLVVGEVAGFLFDFADMFIQRVNPLNLQPSAAPVIYSAGVDLVTHIAPANNEYSQFLVSGYSLVGDFSDPEATILNRLITMKINTQGDTLWRYIYDRAAKTKFGFCSSGGASVHPATGNIMTAGVIHAGAPDMLVDPLFILLDTTGKALDTAAVFVPGVQNLFNTVVNPGQLGVHFSAGETRRPGSPPTLLLNTLVELNKQVLVFVANDTTTPISLRALTEVPVNRFALAGNIPDNAGNFDVSNVIVALPGLDDLEILYQNCALVASLSASNPSFYQWYLNGEPVPGAITGFYFPEQPGTYSVQVIDNVGCIGLSDTLTVTLPTAAFDIAADNGTYVFTNHSVETTTYFWNFGDGATSTATNPAHTYAASGPYPVTLIASGPCGADTLVQMLVETEEATWPGGVRLFPNPTDGVFTLEIKEALQETLAIGLYNPSGQLIDYQEIDIQTEKLQRTFDMGNWPVGIYILQIQSRRGVKYEKVVRQ